MPHSSHTRWMLRNYVMGLLLASFTACMLPRVVSAVNSFVRLRSGVVTLSSADDFAFRSKSTRASSRPNLYLMKYSGNKKPGERLRAAIPSRGGKVLLYIPEDTLLVYMNQTSALATAREQGVLVAVYGPDAKLSPEVIKVIEEQEQKAQARQRRLEATSWKAPSDLLEHVKKLADQDPSGDVRKTPQGRRGRLLTSTDPSLEHLYGFKAFIITGLTDLELQAAYRDWPINLAAALGYTNATVDSCFPRALDHALYDTFMPWLEVYVCSKDISFAVSWLASLPVVTWLAPTLQIGPRNAVAGWISQTGSISLNRSRNATGELRPYWRAGLLGQGVIVGASDTGIDVASCYFIDDNYTPGYMKSQLKELGQACPNCPLQLLMPQHRKIVQYVIPKYGNVQYFGDAFGYHGTHVCGSLAGALPGSGSLGFQNDDATGAAPMSRISFFDLTSQPDFWRIPEPMHEKVLPLHYKAGARHTSDSWGGVGVLATTYDSTSTSYDWYAWQHPEFVSIVAAGNDGQQGEMTSVQSPATAKNVISVGATLNHPKDTPSSVYNKMFLFRYQSNNTLQERALWPIKGSSDRSQLFGWTTLLLRKEVPVLLITAAAACQTLGPFREQTIVLVEWDYTACNFRSIINNVGKSRASAALYIRPEPGMTYEELTPLPAAWSMQQIPYSFITMAQGAWLKDVMSNADNTGFCMTYLAYPQANFGIDTVAAFSAVGLWPDQRIKPDIVAPGTSILSAKSERRSADQANSSTCTANQLVLSGTSMATPVTAGHVSLMRQYFRDGFYPRGSKELYEATPFEPSGILLKAALIAGAKSLQGGYAQSTGTVLGAAPDGYQGWGRLDLSGALPLPGLTSANMRLQVADMGEAQQGDEVHLRGIRATGTGPIIATLVWHDYPAPLQAVSLLVNDLDFKYSINGGSLMTTREDHVNNVERIELTGLQAGDNITLVVSGTKVVFGPQRWAVAVVGHFTGSLKTNLNPSYAKPQRLQIGELSTSKILIGLKNRSGCLSVRGASLVTSSSACGPSEASLFTFNKESDATTTGTVYTVTDSLGRCITMANSSSFSLRPCDNNPNKRLALFKNSYDNGPVFQLVPRSLLGDTNSSSIRMCLMMNGSSPALTTAPCNEDDPLQNFVLQVSESPNKTSVLPPSRAPSLPQSTLLSPQPNLWPPIVVMPWLTFRVDWTVSGALPVDLDIFVSWVADNKEQIITYNSSTARGGTFGGDNKAKAQGFETVSWNRIKQAPDAAEYRVCVKWWEGRGPQLNVTMQVNRGTTRVLSQWRMWDSNLLWEWTCTDTSVGYLGSYRYVPTVVTTATAL